MVEILQDFIPYDVSVKQALPGIAPLAPDGWITEDEAFAAQMAERDRLISEIPEKVFCDSGASLDAKNEILDQILQLLRGRPNYKVSNTDVIRPDGIRVKLNGDPLLTAGCLVQEDLCLHEKSADGEYVLTAGVLCFPSSWTLSEKVGRSLSAVHGPVVEYDENIAKRVQRLFDGIQSGRPVWRFNLLHYIRPDLYQPRKEADARRVDQDYGSGDYTRTEHQSLVRMPKTGSVLFSIHTYIIKNKPQILRPNLTQ